MEEEKRRIETVFPTVIYNQVALVVALIELPRVFPPSFSLSLLFLSVCPPVTKEKGKKRRKKERGKKKEIEGGKRKKFGKMFRFYLLFPSTIAAAPVVTMLRFEKTSAL